MVLGGGAPRKVGGWKRGILAAGVVICDVNTLFAVELVKSGGGNSCNWISGMRMFGHDGKSFIGCGLVNS